MTILILILFYSAFGMAWSYVRWKMYGSAELDFYEKERTRFLAFHRLRAAPGMRIEIPDFLIHEWRNVVKNDVRLNSIPPQASNFQGEICFDAVCWPLAMVFAFMYFVYTITMKHVVDTYNKITDAKIDLIRKDLNMVKKTEKDNKKND